MERKIGEIFEFGGEWYQCVEGNTCNDCAFYRSSCGSLTGKGSCRHDFRGDATNVIFKKLEKVGEPFTGKVHIQLQRYNIYTKPIIDSAENVGYINEGNTIAIEIKQNKEDMEEYKMYDAKEDIPEFDKVVDECLFGKQELKLKPFDIQKAKKGKPVCTKNGKRARIICFNAKGVLPIIALVESGDEEKTVRYSNSGRFRFDGMPDEEDLIMSPERKSGWVNIYRGQVYNTFEKAEEARKIVEHGGDNCLKTIKISWEE